MEGVSPDSSTSRDRLNLDEFAGRTRVPEPKNDSRINKWRGWLERIREDLHDIFLNQAAHTEITSMLTGRAIPGSAIVDCIFGNYARSQAIAVRRQTDAGGQSITLRRLLNELLSNPELITRDWYVGQFPWGTQHLGDRQFNTWAHLDPEHPDPDEPGDRLLPGIVERDILLITNKTGLVRRYVDTHVAHADASPVKDIPTFADLADAITTVGEIFQRYYTLLTLSSITQLDPVPQYDWLAPFRVAWLDS